MGDAVTGKAHALLGWLPAVVPAGASRFRVSDAALRATIADAGGELADARPDVEIAASSRALRGDARDVIVTLDASQPEGGSLLRRAPARALATVTARGRAARARGDLRRRGYATATVMWDIDHVLYLPWVRDHRVSRPPAALLPQRALVLGGRGGLRRTLLQAAADEAGRDRDEDLASGMPLARNGLVVAVGKRAVLRITVGPGRHVIDQQRGALDALARASAPPVIADRLPWTLERGRTGIADWSLDRRLPGREPRGELSGRLLEDCVEFLVALYLAAGREAPPASIAGEAAVVAAACRSDESRARLHALGRTLEEQLADVPRGFGHRDFWMGNILVEGDRLTGVLDWDGGGPGRLPLLDLLHLRLTARLVQTREYLGDAVVRYLLPWATAGGDVIAGAYARRVGLALDRGRLRALVLAYWLDRVAFDIATFAEHARRPVWMSRNVDGVLAALPHQI